MNPIIFFPENEEQLKKPEAIAKDLKITATSLDDEEKKKLGSILLANLRKKNLKAQASMEDIISVVEEVRTEKFYGKKDNNR